MFGMFYGCGIRENKLPPLDDYEYTMWENFIYDKF